MTNRKRFNSLILKLIFYSYLTIGSICTLIGQNNLPLQILTFGNDTLTTSKEFKLSGQIRDESSKESIAGALMYSVESNKSIVSDEKGNFTIILPKGKNTLQISFLGFETRTDEIYIYKEAVHDFQLEEQAINLGEVTIQQNRQNQNITNVLNSVEQMSIKTIEEKSRLLGEADVLRSLQSLSGVSSVGEGASGFNVLGGNTDENLILQDGNLIINPVHALGFFSLFHPDLVKGITLYKADFPAKFGGRLSSVLDVNLREGDKQKFIVKGGVGIVTSRLAVEGPMIKNKVSFIVGARASYFDWLLKRVNNLDLRKSNAFFNDITARMDARLTKSTKLRISTFSSADNFQFAEEVKFDYQTNSAALNLNQIVGKRLNLDLNFNVGKYNSSLYDIAGNNQSRFDNSVQYLRGYLHGFYQASKNYIIEAGYDKNNFIIAPGTLNAFENTSNINSRSLMKENGQENAFFIQNQLKIGGKLEIIAGLRYTYYLSTGAKTVYQYIEESPKSEGTIVDSLHYNPGQKIVSYGGFEPRLSIRYSLNSSSSIKTGISRVYQYISQISNTASATPVDIWQLANQYVTPEQATNFSLGYFSNFKNNTIQTHVSVFYRKIDNLIEYKDFAQLVMNQHIETELLQGKGRAYGIEFSLSKNYGRNRFDCNYTYSRSLRKVEASSTQLGVNQGDWYPSNYDKPNVLNLNYNYKASEKQNISVNFTYSTGRPTTAPISSFINSNVLNIPIFSNRNEYRIPDFHRLDFAYTIGPWGKKIGKENSITFSIYNVYARKNAYSVFFRQKAFQKITAYRLAVLGTMFPAVTYNFKF